LSRLPAIAGSRWLGFSIGYKFCPEGIPSEDLKDLDIVSYNAGIVNKFLKGEEFCGKIIYYCIRASVGDLLI